MEIEGCLSFPDLYGEVERPYYVKVEAQERDGSLYELEAEDYEARAILHEIDHLNGILFNTKMIRVVPLEEIEELENLAKKKHLNLAKRVKVYDIYYFYGNTGLLGTHFVDAARRRLSSCSCCYAAR